MSKKIIVICKSFFPEQTPRAFRATELVLELQRQGHQVDVLLPKIPDSIKRFEHVKFVTYGPLNWKELTASTISWIGDSKRKFGRLLYWFLDYPNIEIYFKLKPVLKQLNGYDLLISIAVPHEIHWAIGAIRSKQNKIAKTWVADCGDPFMGNRLDTVNPPFYFAFFEKRFCAKADYVSVPAQSSLGAYYSKFHPKFRVIPQGFDFSEIKTSYNLRDRESRSFAYAGMVAESGVRGLGPLVNFLTNQTIPFTFHIFGIGFIDRLKSLVKPGDTRFIFHKPLKRVPLIEALSNMDFLINLDNKSPFNTPSKLIDYNLSDRPVCNLYGPEPDTELLVQFLNGNYSKKMPLPEKENYNIKNVVKQFLDLTI